MDAVLRATAIYAGLLVLFRIAGRRSLAEMTPFDLVLLLIIGESTQQALLGEDFSITHALLVIVTLLFIDVMLSIAKTYLPALGRVLDGVPTVVVAGGKPLHRELRKARISLDDVMETARLTRGISSLDEIEYALIEPSGGISIIPRK